MIATIKFNEAINFSGLNVTNAGATYLVRLHNCDPVTVSILSNKDNYIPSEDKKV